MSSTKFQKFQQLCLWLCLLSYTLPPVLLAHQWWLFKHVIIDTQGYIYFLQSGISLLFRLGKFYLPVFKFTDSVLCHLPSYPLSPVNKPSWLLYFSALSPVHINAMWCYSAPHLCLRTGEYHLLSFLSTGVTGVWLNSSSAGMTAISVGLSFTY
jgi:hypothetical protein